MVDDEVEVHGCPMSGVRTQMAARRRGHSAVRLEQQVDRRGRAQQLDCIASEAPTDRQAQSFAIEVNTFFEVIHIDVDEHGCGHGVLTGCRRDAPERRLCTSLGTTNLLLLSGCINYDARSSSLWR